jgi:hypothetical protein
MRKKLLKELVNEQIASIRTASDEIKIKELLVSLMGRNTPTFRQWQVVLSCLFEKKFSDKHVLYLMYTLAGMKVKQENISFAREKEFSDWFWANYKKQE